MLTIMLIAAIILAVLAIIGGVAMMFDGSGSFFSWYFGAQAIKAGFEILASIVPAILEAIASE